MPRAHALTLAVLSSLCLGACGSDDAADTNAATSDGTGTMGDGTTSTSSTGATGPGTAPPADDDGNTLPCNGSLELDATSWPDGVAGEPYDQMVGYSAPAGWDAEAYGELPSGMELEVSISSIHLHGTPAEAGDFTISVALDNGDGGACGSAQDLGLTIAPGADTGSSTDGPSTADSSGSDTGGSSTTGG